VPSAGQKTVTLSGESLRKLKARYDKELKKTPGLAFASFVADSALMELERRDMLRESGSISFVTFEDDIVILRDTRRENKFFEVQRKGRALKCLNDNSMDCVHVGFALALPEVRRVLNG